MPRRVPSSRHVNSKTSKSVLSAILRLDEPMNNCGRLGVFVWQVQELTWRVTFAADLVFPIGAAFSTETLKRKQNRDRLAKFLNSLEAQ